MSDGPEVYIRSTKPADDLSAAELSETRNPRFAHFSSHKLITEGLIPVGYLFDISVLSCQAECLSARRFSESMHNDR